jgi:hypothetical protein
MTSRFRQFPWSRIVIIISLMAAALSSGCISIIDRSPADVSPQNPEKIESDIYVVTHGIFREETQQFLLQTLPFRKVVTPGRDQSKNGAERVRSELEAVRPRDTYSLELIVDKRPIKRDWKTAFSVLTLCLIPGTEEIPINLAATLTNEKTRKVQRYFYQGHVRYRFSSLPIFWDYIGTSDGPPDDLMKDLILELSTDMQKDIGLGQI